MGGVVLALAVAAAAQPAPRAAEIRPNRAGELARALRYTPEDGDFVIRNGAEFFNRPLYGGNTAFRVDAGDLPEFALYLPGRGGNLRLGLRRGDRARWLHEAAIIEARYRPGTMRYAIRDPLLGESGELRLVAIALPGVEGLVVRVEASATPADLELVWAYGGASGKRGRRDGDIGTEAGPIGDYFQVRPEDCRGQAFRLEGARFFLTSGPTVLRGDFPAGASLRLADASAWGECGKLLAADDPALAAPVVTGRMPLAAGAVRFLAVARLDQGAEARELEVYRAVSRPAENATPGAATAPARLEEAPDWPRRFAEAETHFAGLRQQVRVETPDPFIDAAVGALNVAADAVWDEPQGVVMHGAIAWRAKLLGWRGPYAMDALGWTERARRHLAYWATRQNTDPIPAALPPADAGSNLARNEAGLHSNGDLSASHYDMNLVYVDALLRHLRWTGDWAFAREVWLVLERHLAWERRLFRREFAASSGTLPLYEAYAAIWASDDLQYSGGGTAHASAYNYWHNREAARLARKLGFDPAPYAREAAALAEGLRALLWTGTHFAESKDWLGRQLVHPDAALWTYYHVLDAELPTPAEARSMSQDVLGRLPRLPVTGPGVPTDAAYAVHATTRWLPYTWSLNNVVMGENLHTALGLWLAGRPDEAFVLAKSALLASMFMGICPGNVGSMNYLDVYRRESQRDFADGGGVLARAVVEGLFGLRPDAIGGELIVAPGWPAAWTRATLRHPRVSLAYERDDRRERYVLESRLGWAGTIAFALRPQGETAQVRVNGAPVDAALDPATGRLNFHAPLAPRSEVTVEWGGATPAVDALALPAEPAPIRAAGAPSGPLGPLAAVDLAPYFNDRVTELFRPGKYRSPRSPFVSLAIPAQGIGAWAGHVNAMAEIDDRGLRAASAAGGGRITLPGGLTFATPSAAEARNILFTSQWDNYPREATVALAGRARRLHLMMAGSTNPMQSRLDNGEVVVAYADGSTARLALRNPETWWPIEQDYFVDDYQFRVDAVPPVRVDLKTGAVRDLAAGDFRGQGGPVPGGAATVLALSLDPGKELRSLTVRACANDVVIGLLAATLER